ncbi:MULTISPECIES: Ig-like domain-containing protein [Rikenellaceae]|uniref:Ig-like domain-containing protein n=1 Tax=Rikenellaceae TaxID=171550 RepID=UPI00055416DC|nr:MULTISPECIES: Ig-like domain-containing protein [Rikenellaceae]
MLMKRMLLLAVLAGIAAGTAGCKQQDAPKLDRQAVRLYVGDQVRITADRPVAWSAADDFYAAVDADGTVTARHVGTTTVTATADSGSAACTVEVQPRYDTFEEPLYELFGQPLSVLKKAETREILEENDTSIFYKGERPYIAKVQYRFDKGEDPVVFYANIFIEKSYKEEMRNFFFERYEYDGSNDCFYNFRSIPPIMIAFDETEPEYIVVTYFQTHKL